MLTLFFGNALRPATMAALLKSIKRIKMGSASAMFSWENDAADGTKAIRGCGSDAIMGSPCCQVIDESG